MTTTGPTNKSQTMYLACIARGMTHEQAIDLVMAGPLARSRYVTARAFLTWANAQHTTSEREA